MNEPRFELLASLDDAERLAPPMQKLFIEGNILPGTDLGAPRLAHIVDELSALTGMNLFDGPSIKTPDHYDAEAFERLGGRPPEDINVSWMWDDSGGQFYIFPGSDYRIALDLHTCKEFDATAALSYLSEALNFRENVRFAEQTALESTAWQPLQVETPELAHIDRLQQILDVDMQDTEAVMAAGEELERLTIEAMQDGWGNRFAALFSDENKARLREIHGTYEVAIDTQFNGDVLSGKATDASEYRFQLTYDRLARLEVEAAGLKLGDRIVHVGTGWPGTAIGMYKECGIAVTCVEIDPAVAEQSKLGLEKLGLYGPDKITVVNADGGDLDFSRFKSVLVSAMVPTKDKQRIKNNLRALSWGQSMIVRQPSQAATELFYQRLPAGFTEGVRDVTWSTTRPEIIDPLQSICFEPGAMVNPNRSDGSYARATAKKELVSI